MPGKLMTLEELAEYLQVKEEKIIDLVNEGVILAYKIGGELLRFRKEQIDAIRSEINSRIVDSDRMTVAKSHRETKEKLEARTYNRIADTVEDKIADFFHFNDFYIVSAALIAVLLIIIFRGM